MILDDAIDLLRATAQTRETQARDYDAMSQDAMAIQGAKTCRRQSSDYIRAIDILVSAQKELER